MQPIMTVAVKEFKDYLSSKIFLCIFGLLVLITIASIITGTTEYNTQISNYNSILSAASRSTNGVQPQMPSMMLIFETFTTLFTLVGGALAILIGFSLVSKEKETGSLKLLLARPTFRDSVINGKILGATSILVISVAAAFLIGVALLLLEGIVPSGDDISRLILFFLTVVFFSVTFLAIAIAASTVARNSTVAIVLAFMILIFSQMVPYFTDPVSTLVLGPAPAAMIPATGNSTDTGSGSDMGAPGGGMVAYMGGKNSTIRMKVNPAYTDYENKRSTIIELADLISPTSDLTGISNVVVSGQKTPVSSSGFGGQFNFRERGMTSPTLWSTLPSILLQVLSLLVMLVTGFAISYAKFIRMDVR